MPSTYLLSKISRDNLNLFVPLLRSFVDFICAFVFFLSFSFQVPLRIVVGHVFVLLAPTLPALMLDILS